MSLFGRRKSDRQIGYVLILSILVSGLNAYFLYRFANFIDKIEIGAQM